MSAKRACREAQPTCHPRAGSPPPEASPSNRVCWTDSIVSARALPKMEIYTDHPPSLSGYPMLSYVDRSVFRAKLAEKGDPQMMDPKYKTASADFLRRAKEDYGLQRVAIGDPVGNGAEAINLQRFAKEHMLAYLAAIDPDETIPRDTHRVMTFEAGVLLGVIQLQIRRGNSSRQKMRPTVLMVTWPSSQEQLNAARLTVAMAPTLTASTALAPPPAPFLRSPQPVTVLNLARDAGLGVVAGDFR